MWREWWRGRGTPCVRALDAREFAAAPVDTGDVGAAQHVQGAAAGVHAGRESEWAGEGECGAGGAVLQ